MISPIVLKDFYKTDHRRQYPTGTEIVYSNLTPRGSRVPGVDHVVVFGIQYFVKEYLIKRWNEDFFNQPKDEVVRKYKRRLDNALGKDSVPIEHVGELHDLGYLPILLKALPEGTLCPMRIPILTIRNTHPKFFWLTNFMETVMCNIVWGPTTSASTAYAYRKMLDGYAARTSDIPEFVNWQGHDFSMRGIFGIEGALMSAAGHLLSFTGTDTVPAIDFLEEYYGADSDKEMVGGSVPATEHSVMCLGGLLSEEETFRRLLTEIYPTGIVSVVSDTWDYWNVITKTLPALKDVIMNRNGRLVVRPDSGDPVKIICGDAVSDDPAAKAGTVELLWNTFGGYTNAKGFKQLDKHIGVIYGDSITLERCEAICEGLARKGFASTNMVFGIGSYTYQFVTRDTFGFAMKATWGIINGKPVTIYKDPKTDSGIKKSARGLLQVNQDATTGELTMIEDVTPEQEDLGLLTTVFEDGKIVTEYTLADIRKRLGCIK